MIEKSSSYQSNWAGTFTPEEKADDIFSKYYCEMPKTMDNVNNNTFLGTVYWSYCCIHQRPYIESHDKYAYSKLSFLFVANEKKKKKSRMGNEALPKDD